MEFTKGQEAALEAVRLVAKSHPEGGGIVTVSGYAGTGKTSLLRVLAEEQSITVLTPTGKAALRVREVAPRANASTIHMWLYDVAEDPETGKLVTSVREAITRPKGGCIFVDEASMVSLQIARDLYRACKANQINIVFLGDPFQLPPVETKEEHQGFSVLADNFPAHYKVHMTEVVRQALDSPIIRASMALRDPRNDLSDLGILPSVNGFDELIKRSAKVNDDGGAVVCHRNVTRNSLNNDIRSFMGLGEKVTANEPLLVLMNNYDLDVYNGEIVRVLSEPKLLGDGPVAVTDRFANESMNMWFYQFEFEGTQGVKKGVFADKELQGRCGNINMKAIRKAGKQYSRHLAIKEMKAEGHYPTYQELQDIQGLPVVNTNFGYALTCHKAQGSEFATGIVCMEDSVKLHTTNGRRFTYTAITRFKKKVEIYWG